MLKMEKNTVAVVGRTESHQQLKRAEELGRLVSHKKDLYEDKDGWTNHQELVSLYRDLLITDLEFALDRKVEQDLWNFCFKNYISHLQSRLKDKRSSGRADAQLLLSWFLEFASGFYTTFLTEIQQKFELDIPFLQSGDPYGIWSSAHGGGGGGAGGGGGGGVGGGGGGGGKRPGVTSCNYLCQHCLVHLGDVARYRNQTSQAETFYREATSLAPGSGQPYNQIAILEASRANKLSAVYFYVRAICLKYPFPAASTNLSKMLGKFASSEVEKAGKMSQQMFISLLLKLHGLLHHAEKLRLAVKTSRVLSESLTNLIVSESLTTWQLVQVVSINMWACHCHQVAGDQEAPEERLVVGVVAGLQAALLSSCLLPVYTLKKGEQLLDYSALPAVRLLLEWIRSRPAILQERGFTSRPQIWPGLARLLNEVQPLIEKFESSRYRDFPLPEDYDMQAFTPLASSLARYNMKSVGRGGGGGGPRDLDQDSLARLRCERLVELGHSLCGLSPRVIQHCQQSNSFQAVDVELVHVREDPEVLVEEIEMLEDIDSSEDCESPPPVWEEDSKEQTKSILKSKAELTPSPVLTPPGAAPSTERLRVKPFQRNVAMAAIMNCVGASQAGQAGELGDTTDNLLSAEQKKVMFKTPSPGNSQASTVDSSQLSASQDEYPVLANPGVPAVRRSWSPSPAAPRSKICVAELDLSVPPPSLHSNVRPPALFSPGLEFGPSQSQYGQEADNSSSVFSPAGPSDPLLQLLSSVERQDRPSSLGLPSFSAPAPPPSSAPAYPQSYSLFSPSGWPGPLLSSPHTPQTNTQSMFGGSGPSPLERLLHQVLPTTGMND